MKRKIFAVTIAAILLLSLAVPVMAAPPSPDGPTAPPPTGGEDRAPLLRHRQGKPEDLPNMKDYLRNRERQRLLEAGQTAEAEALSLTQDDRVLVILVEYAGTDVYTWNPGDHWDPYGIADDSQGVYDGDGNLIYGDCSNIITETKTFTYTGPLHNEIPRPLSADDRSGDAIWTEDFSPGWFEAFMFGDGVVFDYTREDSSVVHEDFSGQSVKDYYLDMSGGQYEIAGDVVGWVQVPHSTQYYSADQCPGKRGPYDSGTDDGGVIPGAGTESKLIVDALDAVNAAYPDFDWAKYDIDGDGVVDRLWIVHAGYGEEDGTVLLNRTPYGESAVWSHSSAIKPYEVAEGITVSPYIVMPENGGIGVFAHEYAHNLGADDLYAYVLGDPVGFWALQSDDWTGYPIGFEPPAVDPWHLDNWGWLDPMVITDTTQVYTATLGQASHFPDEEGMYRGAKIMLADGVVPLSVPIWQGDYYWWGGKQNLANAMMTTATPIAIPGGAAAALSFDLVYDVEDEWDFFWVQASEDGTNWDTLTNANTQCVHDPSWVGEINGFPQDLCGAGIGGFYGYNANWPEPEAQEFDLSAYAGKSIYLRLWYMTDWATSYTGVFVDNVKVEADGATLFEDDAESGDANWVYAAPWERSDGTIPFTHNYYLQWRNVNENGGYDSALGEERWRFGPANTGLLVWYNNNAYTDNEVYYYLTDYPSFGPKARMLVVDSQPEPYRDPDFVEKFPNEGANISHRGLMRDAPFTLADTVPFTHTDPYRPGGNEHSYEGRPAVSSFHDAMGYYPGAEFTTGGPFQGPRWITKQWDASAVVPGTADYALKAPGYTGGERMRYGCYPGTGGNEDFTLCYSFAGLGYDGGTGNPGDSLAQYGWHVELLEEAADHTSATVRIWNSMYELDSTFAADVTTAAFGDELTYTHSIKENIGGQVDVFVAIPLPDTVEYVPNSTFGGAVLLPAGLPVSELADVYAKGGKQALLELASSSATEGGTIVWTGTIGTGQSAPDFGFKVTVKIVSGEVNMTATLYNEGVVFQTTPATPVTITPAHTVYLPIVMK